MKHIFTLFLAFLLPTLPAFGVSNFDGFTGFKQSYQSCALDVKKSGFDLEISDLPEKYQTMYKNHAKETVTTAIDGKCNGVSYTCKPGNLVTCNPCHMFSYFTKTIKPQYIAELTEEKCGHLKQTSSETSTKSSAAPTKQTASKPTTTAAPADEDFDFVAAQKSDRAAYETDYEAEPYGTTTTTAKPKSSLRAGDDNELQMVGEIHAADAAADAERAKPKQTKKEPDFDFAAQSANDMNASAARSGLLATPAPEPATPEKSERQKNIENNMKKDLTVQPKTEKKKAEKQEQNKIGKRCEIENAKSAKYAQQPSGAIVCEPDECICGYEIVVKSSNNYTCQKWKKTPSCLSQDLAKNATKGHYECKNDKKVCVIDDCDYKTHYLDSAKNKCVAKSTVKCADDEVVNNAGKCQKNVKVDFNKPGDITGHEWTEADGERMKCDQDKDKKHTKFENNKCVCESDDYEMQSDGYCTLKRAKCLKQKNTKYENGRCVCTSDDYTMQPDNNCILTSPDAIAAEASEMEDAENAAELEKLDLETRKELCATYDRGEWDTDNNKCKCKNGYKLSKTGECEPNKRTLSNNEKKALCEKNGAGKWTEKNKCECTDKTHSFDDELGCTENKIKTKRANKEAENNRKKELCKSPNTWNDTLNKCTCKDKKQFFDDELGCTAASQAFTNAETELNTLKGQLDTKLTELASVNESEEQ